MLIWIAIKLKKLCRHKTGIPVSKYFPTGRHGFPSPKHWESSVNCGSPSMENRFQVGFFLFEVWTASSLFCLVQMVQGSLGLPGHNSLLSTTLMNQPCAPFHLVVYIKACHYESKEEEKSSFSSSFPPQFFMTQKRI